MASQIPVVSSQLPDNEQNSNEVEVINLNQAFFDTIRNSEGNNKKRLLLIAGANDELELTTSQYYKLPIDKSNKMSYIYYKNYLCNLIIF